MSRSGLIQQLAAVSRRTVSRETFDRIEAYVSLLKEASGNQNLIAPSTLETIWERHVVDSAQLLRFEPFEGASWVDVGSGAGLPGIIIALLAAGDVTLVEPRKLRADFLRGTAEKLGLGNQVSIQCSKIERVTGEFDVITARAVAALDHLLAMTTHISKRKTKWVLPKGRNAQSELAQARLNWHCNASVEQSCTDPDSEILVVTRVGAK